MKLDHTLRLLLRTSLPNPAVHALSSILKQLQIETSCR